MTRCTFPPGVGLLIAAGRRSLDPSVRESPTATREDWTAAVRAAERHGMSSWLAAAMQQWPGAPDEIRQEVSAAAYAHAGRALQGVAELAEVATRLRDGGIPVVALKGPLFSQWLYGTLGARRFVDLDLLIERSERTGAWDILSRAGYEFTGGASPRVASVIYAGTGAWPLTRAGGFPLDLHWSVQGARFGAVLDPAEVMRKSQVMMIAGCEIRIPHPTHSAALTLAHAAKHLWASLELTLSTAHLMRRDDVDWGDVHAIMERAGSWNGAAAGLCLASELFQCELPAPLCHLPRQQSVSHLVTAARAFLSMANVEDAPRAAEFRTHSAALDTRRGRLAYAAWRLLAPTPLERAWCRLPDSLAVLYVPVRLVRLSLETVVRVVASEHRS